MPATLTEGEVPPGETPATPEVKVPATPTKTNVTAIPAGEDLPREVIAVSAEFLVPIPDEGIAGALPGEVPNVPAEDETPADDPTPAAPAEVQVPAPTEAEGHITPTGVKTRHERYGK